MDRQALAQRLKNIVPRLKESISRAKRDIRKTIAVAVGLSLTALNIFLAFYISAREPFDFTTTAPGIISDIAAWIGSFILGGIILAVVGTFGALVTMGALAIEEMDQKPEPVKVQRRSG